jgi:hypothetical protein
MFFKTPSLIEILITIVVEMLPIFPSERVSCVRMGDYGALVTLGGRQSVRLHGFLPEVEEKRIDDGYHPKVCRQC